MGVSAESEIDFDDARIITEWALMMGKIPPANMWLDGIVNREDPMGGFI